MLRWRRFALAALFVHLLLVVIVATRSFVWSLQLGKTLLPVNSKGALLAIETLTGRATGDTLPSGNAYRQTIAFYLGAAGIDAGYGFFAPNVPDNIKLVFEVEHSDGYSERILPRVSNEAMGLRLVNLLDNLSHLHTSSVRLHVIRTLATRAIEDDADVTCVRAVLGVLQHPSLIAYRNGGEAVYEPSWVYDFMPNAPSPSK